MSLNNAYSAEPICSKSQCSRDYLCLFPVIEFYPASGEYYPVVFFNDYWNLHSDYQPVNKTTPFLNFSVTYQPISLIRWQLYAGMTMRNKMYGNLFGTDLLQESDDDQDALKKTLIETNPYLLAMTIVVSLLHSVFEFLAFKNGEWRGELL